LAHEDGREWTGYSPCQWCCGEACVEGGTAKCEPKAHLEKDWVKYTGTSRNGLGEDNCPTTKPQDRKPADVKVLMHYMIWFGENPGHDHWTGGVLFNEGTTPIFDNQTDGCNNADKLNSWFPPVSGKFNSTNRTAVGLDMKAMVDAGVYGIIIDHQLPDPKTIDGQTLRNALPVAIEEAIAAGLKWSIMYDGSNSRQKEFKFGDPIVDEEWAAIIYNATKREGYADSYLTDSEGKKMFFAFGDTPFPNADNVQCENCVFYAHGGRQDTGVASGGRTTGAFAWFDTMEMHNNFYGDFGANKYKDPAPAPLVGVAYAGMEPIYKFKVGYNGDQAVYEAHSIPRSTQSLTDSLALCAQYSEFCQIASWNDFNEGTHIQNSYWCDNERRTGGAGSANPGTLAPDAFVQALRKWKGLDTEPTRRLDTVFV
jgi:hypothetical protein